MAANELSSFAYFCILQRPDGVGLAVTSHDREVEIDGVSHDPAPAIVPSELTLCDDLFSSALRFTGAITSNGLRADDLKAGRWTAASMLLSGGDWSGGVSPALLCRGQLGDIRVRDGGVEGDIDLVPPRAREQPNVQTSPECRAQLGDLHCRVAMRGRTKRTSVLAVDGLALTLNAPEIERFANGKLRWVSGRNCGIDQALLNAGDGRIHLREPPPFTMEIGDRVVVSEGCDGRVRTCSERFANIANFRGEPHLPGTDFVTRYPGG